MAENDTLHIKLLIERGKTIRALVNLHRRFPLKIIVTQHNVRRENFFDIFVLIKNEDLDADAGY